MSGARLRSGRWIHALVVTVGVTCSPSVLDAQTGDDLPQASTVSAIAGSETSTFIDSTLVGRDAADLVGKWIRVFTADRPAGFITKVTAFDSETGQLTLQDPLPAGAVKHIHGDQFAFVGDIQGIKAEEFEFIKKLGELSDPLLGVRHGYTAVVEISIGDDAHRRCVLTQRGQGLNRAGYAAKGVN